MGTDRLYVIIFYRLHLSGFCSLVINQEVKTQSVIYLAMNKNK